MKTREPKSFLGVFSRRERKERKDGHERAGFFAFYAFFAAKPPFVRMAASLHSCPPRGVLVVPEKRTRYAEFLPRPKRRVEITLKVLCFVPPD